METVEQEDQGDRGNKGKSRTGGKRNKGNKENRRIIMSLLKLIMSTDLDTSGRFFRYSYLYTSNDSNIVFEAGKLGILGGKLLPLKYPR